MKYKIKYNNFSSVFAVPTSVVSNYIKLASGLALKVLLIILNSGDNLPTISDLSSILCEQNEENIIDAINFWIQVGVLSPTDTEEISNINKNHNEYENKSENIKENKLNIASNEPKKVNGRNTLPRQEALEAIEKNSELSALVLEFQQLTGKTLTSSDIESIVAMYTYYNLSADYILMAAHYCYSIGKCSMRYVEKAVTSWYDNGIDSHEKLDNYIQKLTEQNESNNIIKCALGINDRQLTSNEKTLISKWTCEYKFDVVMIKLAYEKTIDSIGKLSLKYMDTIISNWKEKNIRTPQKALEENNNFKNSTKTNKISENSSYNYDELDKIINGNFIK